MTIRPVIIFSQSHSRRMKKKTYRGHTLRRRMLGSGRPENLRRDRARTLPEKQTENAVYCTGTTGVWSKCLRTLYV